MKKIALLGFAFFFVSMAMGSHLRCGYITAERRNCTSRELYITIMVYTNTASDVKFGEDGILNFGDGTSIVVPRIENVPQPHLGPNIGVATYTVRHLFPSEGIFLISYVEPNRNGGVLNMNDSFYTTFYIETSALISNEFGCTSAPRFLTPPVLQAAAGTEFTYSMGVSSPVDDFITYELVTPYRDRGTPVSEYIKPGNLSINYLTGLLTWDTKFSGPSSQPGEYNFAVQINQYVKTGDTYRKIGFVRIDFQVIVNGDVPEPVIIQDNQELDEYSRLLVPEGAEKKIKVFFESQSPTLEAFSELVGTEALSFQTYDSTHEESTFKVGVLTINPNAALVRENPYLITVRAKSGQLGSDINYLIYTDEIPEFPVIVEPDPVTATEKEIAQIEVFPNPVQEHVLVQVNRPGTSEVLLYNIQGKLIALKTFELQTELLMHELPAGVYICDIRRNNISIRRIKLIKQ